MLGSGNSGGFCGGFHDVREGTEGSIHFDGKLMQNKKGRRWK